MLVLGLVLAGIVIVLVWPGEREPEYQGKKLSEWILTYRPELILNGPGKRDGHAADAVRHIGTNALPWLLRWVRYKQPVWRSKLYVAYCKLPIPQSDALERYLWPNRREVMAVGGFEILGPQASPAIPELVRLMYATNKPAIAWRATICLVEIGRPALPELQKAHWVTGPYSGRARWATTNLLWVIGPETLEQINAGGATTATQGQSH